MLSLAILLPGCSGEKSKSESADASKAYALSLGDSIATLETRIDSCETQISQLSEQVDVWLRDFTTVSNPREVGAYYIYTPCKNLYPLKGTGLAARINDNEQFELIAAYRGSSFDRIMVEAPTEQATSETVPPDQALNYTSGGLTTVLFTSEKADAIGELVADNELNPITVTFMKGGAVGTMRLPGEYAKMISYTWMLYDAKQKLSHTERRLSLLREQVNLLRAHRDRI